MLLLRVLRTGGVLSQSLSGIQMRSTIPVRGGTQITCFTGTKVQILTRMCEEVLSLPVRGGAQFTFFTGTNVQILTRLALQSAGVLQARLPDALY